MKSKRFFSAVLATAVVMSLAVSGQAASLKAFSDIDSSHLNMEAIDYLRSNGIVEGYSDGQYKPDREINRAEFLKILLESSDSDIDETAKNCYADVRGEWFAKYVCTASKLGFVEGYSDGRFRPEQPINFAEAAKISAEVLNLKTEAQGEVWYEKYVRALDAKEAVPVSMVSFDQKVNRGEMAELAWRVLENPDNVATRSYERIKAIAASTAQGGALQKFASCAEVTSYLKESSANVYRYGIADDAMMLKSAPTPAPAAAQTTANAVAESDSGASSTPDYSSTNVQVQGVDEADIVKTDGKYIYLVKGKSVRIVSAYPATSMKELSAVTFADDSFRPTDMYVDGDRLVILGQSYENIYELDTPVAKRSLIAPPYYSSSLAKVYIFDISNKSDVKQIRELSFEGNYSTSRKIDGMVYLVANKYQYYYDAQPVEPVPLYLDSAEGAEAQKVLPCGEIWYQPIVRNTNYLVLAGIPIEDAKADVVKELVLGNSGNVYSSQDNLYVAESKFDWYFWRSASQRGEETVLHKFALASDEIDYKGNATVPGTVLNQFSMDENDGYFRIATTIGEVWNTQEKSKNNVYVLDKNLKRVGSIEGIAPGERIYSVRFMGDRAYMVTFKKIDPFFVIDLASPSNPKILGKLKIPGYSDYLHPLDADHIIGFGKDTIDPREDEDFRDFDFAWYQGMKVAMFDVSDVSNPKELHKIVIGDRGTDSPLLHDHKALLFDAQRGLMSFPIQVNELDEKVKNDPRASGSEYGSPVFQGAYVYDVSVEDGFELRGTVTHYDENELRDKAGDYWYGNADIQRVLYIGDYLYSVSNTFVQANNLDDLKEVNEVELEVRDGDEPDYYYPTF